MTEPQPPTLYQCPGCGKTHYTNELGPECTTVTIDPTGPTPMTEQEELNQVAATICEAAQVPDGYRLLVIVAKWPSTGCDFGSATSDGSYAGINGLNWRGPEWLQ
jgi:hypothetical protein